MRESPERAWARGRAQHAALHLRGELEKDSLRQLAAQDPRFAELLTEPRRSQE